MSALNRGGTRAYGIVGDFDLVDSAERQSSFLWQVSGERFNDLFFLREGMINYERFLNLMRLNPGKQVLN